MVRREVRRAWFERYYWEQAQTTLQENREVFLDLISIVESLYSTGRQTQQDILQAELELQLLEDRLIDVSRQIDTSKATLAKWVGADAFRALPQDMPTLARPMPEQEILDGLGNHPSIRQMEWRIDARRSDVELARQEYKPGWKLDVGYGSREDDDLTGRDRSDFVTAMVTFDVPLFTKNRQTRKVEARNQKVRAEQFRRDDRLRDLARMLETEYASWVRLGEREMHYSKAVTRLAEDNLTASLQAYQADVTDFSSLMRAQLIDLETELKDQRIRVDRAKAHAAILYLQGEDS
jgi:outer membrane protein TolC